MAKLRIEEWYIAFVIASALVALIASMLVATR